MRKRRLIALKQSRPRPWLPAKSVDTPVIITRIPTRRLPLLKAARLVAAKAVQQAVARPVAAHLLLLLRNA